MQQAVISLSAKLQQKEEELRNLQKQLTAGENCNQVDFSVKFCLNTMDGGGRQYSSSVRALCYSLLANQVSPAKIHGIIEAV